jgi:hypothetical protein
MASDPKPKKPKKPKKRCGASSAGRRRQASSASDTVVSKAEVDALLTQAAGATLTDRPHNHPGDLYSGYFCGPDGHLWEILYNPRLVRPQEWSHRQRTGDKVEEVGVRGEIRDHRIWRQRRVRPD